MEDFKGLAPVTMNDAEPWFAKTKANGLDDGASYRAMAAMVEREADELQDIALALHPSQAPKGKADAWEAVRVEFAAASAYATRVAREIMQHASDVAGKGD